jgi:hypothetical protein
VATPETKLDHALISGELALDTGNYQLAATLARSALRDSKPGASSRIRILTLLANAEGYSGDRPAAGEVAREAASAIPLQAPPNDRASALITLARWSQPTPLSAARLQEAITLTREAGFTLLQYEAELTRIENESARTGDSHALLAFLSAARARGFTALAARQRGRAIS